MLIGFGDVKCCWRSQSAQLLSFAEGGEKIPSKLCSLGLGDVHFPSSREFSSPLRRLGGEVL